MCEEDVIVGMLIINYRNCFYISGVITNDEGKQRREVLCCAVQVKLFLFLSEIQYFHRRGMLRIEPDSDKTSKTLHVGIVRHGQQRL